MSEQFDLFQRFRLWLAKAIGGAVHSFQVRMLEEAIFGWREVEAKTAAENAELKQELVDYQRALYDALKDGGFKPIALWANMIELSHDGRFAILKFND